MDSMDLAQALLDLFDRDLTRCLHWMDTPNKALGNVTPLDRAREDGNPDAVITLVNQISHGIII